MDLLTACAFFSSMPFIEWKNNMVLAAGITNERKECFYRKWIHAISKNISRQSI